MLLLLSFQQEEEEEEEEQQQQLVLSIPQFFFLLKTPTFKRRKPLRILTRIDCHVGHSRLSNAEIVESCHLSLRNRAFLSPLVTRRRKPDICVCDSQLSSDYDVSSSDVEEETLSSAGEDTLKLAGTPAGQSKSRDVKHEVLMLSFPAIGGQALEPLAQLMETAYIGRLGPVELGSAGISTNIFNCISKLFNIPLLSVATSFVAEDISKNSVKDSASEDSTNGKPAERKQLSSVSTALLLAVGIGIIEALALYLGSGKFLDLMGISSGSSMRIPAQRFLSLRAFGAPAVVVSLALQGVFRGIGNLSAVFLFPILMYYFQLGATGAAISTVLSQYIVTFLLIWHLNKRAVLLPPKLGSLQFGGYLKSGGFLLGRTLAVLITMTLGTSMAARQGPVAMAAHQICIRVARCTKIINPNTEDAKYVINVKQIAKALKSELEKASPSLGRSAIYLKESRINGLPRYLTVQFVRFFWKRESNQKVKILRKVDYPLELDIYDLCSDDLRKKLEAPRKILRDEEGKKLGLKASEKSLEA
ncbi:hypothetical protein CMV_012787 [Castanea mollissima]|uniref:Protein DETOXIFICATION n=1 Tax=Castanea mollissima TaxID=60419 RepID=A0A8J4R0L6_9ROSI|nr:hypothetical protein CMV_012787 [Castanea mollissima]